MPLSCTHNWNSAPNLNILLSALECLECFLFSNNTLLFAKSVEFSLRFIEIKKKPTMENVVIVG